MDREVLPSGTVTFAFTDIEGSTQRWERDRGAMDDALQRHDAILRDAIRGNGGAVFKTIGDAFCAAFARPADAMAAIVAAQRSLAANDFSAVGGLRIRAAIHTGNAEERDGDYFGPPVNRVARLLGIAYGGQVLVSGTTRDLTTAALPPGLALRDLGRHRLKDLIEPEHVFQLVAPDLDAEFPALRSLEALRHNLPQQMTALIGRETEVAEITSLLATHRLVMVLGPGGIGKTRTTLQVGANLLDGTGDGVWVVELAPLATAEYLPATIARAMELHLGPESDPIEALVHALAAKRALLIFDNCEHLVDGVSAVAGAILRRCPQIAVIASSRQALGIAGEAPYRMPSLAPPAAIALFGERARAADPRFAPADADAAAIAEICRKLDGIPLAIELAAARVKILRPAQLLARLDERFRVLTGGRRDALPRQQTLQALIDWSHDLLDERERALFRRIGIFADGFTIDGAIAVGAVDGLDDLDVLDVLASLVDKSLVATEPDGDEVRYRLLESMRAYAREKLRAAGEERPAGFRHATYFASLAARAYEEFDTKMPPGWLHQYASEIDDLRAALTFSFADGDPAVGAALAADCGPIFLRMELLAEGLRWCEAARAVDGVPAATKGRIEYVASMMHHNLAESRRALVCAERALGQYEGSGDERGLVRVLSQVAQLYSRAGRIDDAAEPAERALRRARELGEPRVLSSVLRRCASSLPADRLEDARGYFSEALDVARTSDDREEAGLVLEWWANREAAAGSHARSIELATEALAFATGDARIPLDLTIAGLSLALGRADEAAPHARDALQRSLAVDNPIFRAYAIACWAPARATADPHQAAMLFGYAMARLREVEWEPEETDTLAFRHATDVIERSLGATGATALYDKGASMSEDAALAAIRSAINSAAGAGTLAGEPRSSPSPSTAG